MQSKRVVQRTTYILYTTNTPAAGGGARMDSRVTPTLRASACGAAVRLPSVPSTPSVPATKASAAPPSSLYPRCAYPRHHPLLSPFPLHGLSPPPDPWSPPSHSPSLRRPCGLPIRSLPDTHLTNSPRVYWLHPQQQHYHHHHHHQQPPHPTAHDCCRLPALLLPEPRPVCVHCMHHGCPALPSAC